MVVLFEVVFVVLLVFFVVIFFVVFVVFVVVSKSFLTFAVNLRLLHTGKEL